MKFFKRTSIFFILFGLILLFFGYTVTSFTSYTEKDRRYSNKRKGGEREYTVFIDKIKRSEETPIINTYGEVKSWRTLEIRAPVVGKISEVAKIFRDGSKVMKGDFLFSIEDTEYKDSLAIAKADLRDAESDLVNAKTLFELAKLDLEAAEKEKTIRLASFERQQKLKSNGVISETIFEQSSLALTNSEKSLIMKKNSFVQAKNKIFKAEVLVERKKVAHDLAKRQLADTKFFAPFAGVLDQVNAVTGRLISSNDRLGEILDPKALEVVFPLSDIQYPRITDKEGNFIKLKVEYSSGQLGNKNVYSGIIERVGGQVNTGNTGRQVFASISAQNGLFLKPGDFVKVKIFEPKLKGIAKLPLGSLGSNNTILLVNDDLRLEKINIDVIRFQENHILVKNVPFDRKFVTKWSPQIDAGVKVKVIDSSKGAEGVKPAENETIKLTDEERDKLINAVENNKWIPKDVKNRLVKQLSQELVPKKVVDRLRKRMGG